MYSNAQEYVMHAVYI